MTSGDADHRRLAAAIASRKKQLRLQWEEIAEAAGITSAHLRKFRSGETGLRPATQAGLETALAWQAGAFDRIKAGEQPVPLQHEQAAAEAKAPASPPPQGDRQTLLRVVDGGAVSFTAPRGASEEHIQEMANRIAEFARQLNEEYGYTATGGDQESKRQ